MAISTRRLFWMKIHSDINVRESPVFLSGQWGIICDLIWNLNCIRLSRLKQLWSLEWRGNSACQHQVNNYMNYKSSYLLSTWHTLGHVLSNYEPHYMEFSHSSKMEVDYPDFSVEEKDVLTNFPTGVAMMRLGPVVSCWKACVHDFQAWKVVWKVTPISLFCFVQPMVAGHQKCYLCWVKNKIKTTPNWL